MNHYKPLEIVKHEVHGLAWDMPKGTAFNFEEASEEIAGEIDPGEQLDTIMGGRIYNSMYRNIVKVPDAEIERNNRLALMLDIAKRRAGCHQHKGA